MEDVSSRSSRAFEPAKYRMRARLGSDPAFNAEEPAPMPQPLNLSSSIESVWCTRFYSRPNYDGDSFKMCNIYEDVNIDWKLSNNDPSWNDRITSIKVGTGIMCVLCAEHTYFRGEWLWLIGGQSPSKKDLRNVNIPGPGSWNNKISSIATGTVSPLLVVGDSVRVGVRGSLIDCFSWQLAAPSPVVQLGAYERVGPVA